jgi:vitamin B12 transporter
MSTYDRDYVDKRDHDDLEGITYPDNSYYQNYVRSYKNSRWYKIDYQHNFYFPKFDICNISVDNTFTGGFEFENERAKSRRISSTTSVYTFGTFRSVSHSDSNTFSPTQSANMWSGFIQDKISLNDMFFTTIGARWDNHSQAGSYPTIRIVPCIYIAQTGTKLKGSYGTGFKAPTLDELYNASYGNDQLEPETSNTWELGFEQFLFDEKVQLGLTYFQNNFRDMISWQIVSTNPFQGMYLNVDEAEANGLELFASVYLMENLRFGFNYTYLHTEDQTTRERLLRRPKNTVNLDLNYSFFNGKGNINCEMHYVGNRNDYGQDFSVTTLEGYAIFNVAARFRVHDNIEIFGKIHNLFDDYYEEVFGYDTQRFSMFGGVKLEM